jgi:hypothetical protein
VTGRVERHLLDQPAVLFFGVGAVRERAAGVPDAGGQLVAKILQLAQGEQPGAAAA